MRLNPPNIDKGTLGVSSEQYTIESYYCIDRKDNENENLKTVINNLQPKSRVMHVYCQTVKTNDLLHELIEFQAMYGNYLFWMSK